MAQSTITNGQSAASVRAALNTMFGDLYATIPFSVTAKITSAAAGTAVHVLPDASVPAGKRAYVTTKTLNVNGNVAWTDATATGLTIQDTAGVVGITIPKALLLGNALLNLWTATLTLANLILRGTGFTAAKGIDIVADANFTTGSDIYVTLTGVIK